MSALSEPLTAVRIVGNVLIVVASKDHELNNVESWMIAGLIFQGMGYSFMVSAMILFMGACRSLSEASSGKEVVIMGSKIRSSEYLDRLLNLANLAALILLIVGFSLSAGAMDTTSRPPGFETLDGTIKAGNILYIGITFVLAVMIARLIRSGYRDYGKAEVVALGGAIICMLERCAFMLYLTFKREPYQSNAAARIVCQYAMEACTILGFYVFSFYFPRNNTSRNDTMIAMELEQA